MFIDGGEGIDTANPDGSNVQQVMFTSGFSAVFNGPDWGVHRLAVAVRDNSSSSADRCFR
jgi:hypothetical protein